MPMRVLAGALVCALAATSSSAWAPDAAAQKRIAGGQAWADVSTDAEGAATIHSEVDIAAPPRLVWSVLNDCARAPRMIGNLERCVVLQGDMRKGWDVREQDSKGNLFVPELHNIVRADYTPYTLVRFRRAGGELMIEDGEWRLEPIDGQSATRVIYINRVKARILAPAFLVRAGLRVSTTKVLMNLRRECLSDMAKRV